MGRWSQYDEDDYRLPEGMKRVGYDADLGKYFFRDREGQLWEGQEGVEFGELTRVSTTRDDGDDVENGPQRADGYALLTGDADDAVYRRHSAGSPYRMLFPFFLIIIVMLLLVWRLIISPSLIPVKYAECPEGSSRVVVVAGDTCWRIAEAHGCGLEALRTLNADLVCERLMPGDQICVPNVVSS